MSAQPEKVLDPVLINKIRRARVYDVAERSAITESPRLAERLGLYVLLKREDHQSVFSF